MSRNPFTLVILLASWGLALLAGASLLWQGLAERNQPGRSKLHTYWNGVKFRFRILAGILLIGLVMAGAVWAYLSWS